MVSDLIWAHDLKLVPEKRNLSPLFIIIIRNFHGDQLSQGPKLYRGPFQHYPLGLAEAICKQVFETIDICKNSYSFQIRS